MDINDIKLKIENMLIGAKYKASYDEYDDCLNAFNNGKLEALNDVFELFNK